MKGWCRVLPATIINHDVMMKNGSKFADFITFSYLRNIMLD